MRTCLFAALLPLLASAQELPEGAAIVDRYLEATGGREVYANLRTYSAAAVIEYAGKPARGTFQVVQAVPDRSYSVMDIAGLDRVESGTRDGIAWERSKRRGVRLKAGEERALALREANPRSRLLWREHYRSAECTGVELINSIPCYRVVMTPKEGKPETRYYDQFSGLLLKIVRVVSTPLGEVPSEASFANYRPVDGIGMPHSLTQTMLNTVMSTRIEMVKLNAEIPDSRFDLPPEVKALVEKTAAAPKVESKK